ncbi:FAD-dependent oxidoreductase [Parabacteroides chinchillae]
MKRTVFSCFFACIWTIFLTACQQPKEVDVLIIGGGASGTAAGIQAARLGANTLIVEEYEWLGGALTSAGVSCIDGNYRLPSGIFGEFRNELSNYYGGTDSLRTSWVSAVAAEPSVMNKIFKQMAEKENRLDLWYNSTVQKIEKMPRGWRVVIDKGGEYQLLEAKVLIDGTELGDVAKACGVKYDIGMEAKSLSGEDIGPEVSNNIIQDLTYVAILKDYGKDVTIAKPKGYDPSIFYCTCKYPKCKNPKKGSVLWDKDRMITYGKLPNNKYMINWPIEGNDYYLNIIEMKPKERKEALQKAKNFTMCFIYYLQNELGFNTLGLADDEFPTADKLPFIPYHRESRRIHGLVRFNVNHMASPYAQPEKLYRTAIAVGDYAVDHHHARYPEADKLPELHFYPVPSYGLPLGVIIPKDVDHLLVTEKSISVSNLVNGTTRLQPILVQIGQAAGALAGLAVREKKDVSEVSIREVQSVLLRGGCYLLPFLDLPKTDRNFAALQRIGATGILKGRGTNRGWSNETWFDADSALTAEALLPGLKDYYPNFNPKIQNKEITVKEAIQLTYDLMEYNNSPAYEKNLDDFINSIAPRWDSAKLSNFSLDRAITRKEFAVLLNYYVNPFETIPIDIKGNIINK